VRLNVDARPNATRLLVLVLAASAGVHVALVPMHVDEGLAAQVPFALSGATLFAAALAVERSGGRAATASAALLLATLIAAYAATRLTVVWPFEHAEETDALGLLTKLLEAAGLVLAIALLRTHADRSSRPAARPKELAP
jgi:hypothetical protein